MRPIDIIIQMWIDEDEHEYPDITPSPCDDERNITIITDPAEFHGDIPDGFSTLIMDE